MKINVKGQTRRMSFIESLANVAIGFGVALAAQLVVFPAFGLHVAFHDNLAIGAIFTGVSIVRSYFVRRLFNWLHFKPVMDRLDEEVFVEKQMEILREEIEKLQ